MNQNPGLVASSGLASSLRPVFVVCFPDGSVQTWDVREQTFVGGRFLPAPGAQKVLGFTRHEGRTIAASTAHSPNYRQALQDIWLWDVGTGRPLHGSVAYHHRVTAFTFARIGGELLGLSAGKARNSAGSPELVAWRVADGQRAPAFDRRGGTILRELSDVGSIIEMSVSESRTDLLYVATTDPKGRSGVFMGRRRADGGVSVRCALWDIAQEQQTERHRPLHPLVTRRPRHMLAGIAGTAQEVQYRQETALLLSGGHGNATLLDEGLRVIQRIRGPAMALNVPPTGTEFQTLRTVGRRLLLVRWRYETPDGIEVHDFESGHPIGPPFLGHLPGAPYGEMATFTLLDGAVIASTFTQRHVGHRSWLVWRVNDGEIIGGLDPAEPGAAAVGAYPSSV